MGSRESRNWHPCFLRAIRSPAIAADHHGPKFGLDRTGKTKTHMSRYSSWRVPLAASLQGAARPITSPRARPPYRVRELFKKHASPSKRHGRSSTMRKHTSISEFQSDQAREASCLTILRDVSEGGTRRQDDYNVDSQHLHPSIKAADHSDGALNPLWRISVGRGERGVA